MSGLTGGGLGFCFSTAAGNTGGEGSLQVVLIMEGPN